MSSPADQAVVQPGDVLAGKYRVERVLGVGGMGVVVAAHHIQLDEKVALKFLRPQSVDAESRARFIREARAAVKIKSEHVARVTDVGELEGGAPYMVMEYLEGADLAAWLHERGPMPIEQAVGFVLQTCEAIADAHVLGIVHRDLKPANLFCTQRTNGELSIKVLDFGISKVTKPGAAGHDMTGTHVLMGSPHYMSPEQMQKSKGVDQRTDIWSLGVILYELLTGKPPFDADAVTELAIMVANDPTPSLRASRPEAPVGLEQVIATCLAKDRTKRFQNVGELAVALKDYGPKASRLSVERVLGTLQNAGVSSPGLPLPQELHSVPPPTSLAVLPVNVPQTAATWQTVSEPKVGRKTVVGIAMAGALALALVVGVLVFHKSAPPTPVAVASPGATTPSPSETPRAAVSLTPIVEPSAAPSAPSVASSPAPSASSSAPDAVPAASRPTPNRARPAPPPKPAAANCTPPYTFDSAGYRHYKPECL